MLTIRESQRKTFEERAQQAFAVSYTHLDVYKRQLEFHATWHEAGPPGVMGILKV